MSGHSRFGASAAHRWLRCPGSITASEGIENVSSAFAEEGSMLHGVCENLLRDGVFDADLTDEQAEVVSAYVETVRREHEAIGGTLLIEQRFKLPDFAELWGTADAVIISRPHLRVIDFKAGRGVAVEVDYGGKINPQLGFYVLGALSIAGDGFDDIEVIVVQPRLGGVKRRKVTLAELHDLRDRMLAAVEDALSPFPTFEAGSWCKFCLARSKCVTLESHVRDLARDEFGTLRDPEQASAAKLADILDEADVVETWLAAVRDRAQATIEGGGTVPGWKLTPKRAVRKWRDERIVKQRLASEGLTDFLVEELVSPTQAERLAKKQRVAIDLSDLTVSESSGMKLTRDAERGTATAPATDFAD